MVHQYKSICNDRDYCREQILRYLDYYKKENYKEIGASFSNSIAQYVSKIARDIHGAYYFCDEIDIEKLFAKYVEYKNLNTSQHTDDFIKMLMGYMARRLQANVNEFYRLLKKGKYSVQSNNILSSNDESLFLKRIKNLCEENPKIIRQASRKAQ